MYTIYRTGAADRRKIPFDKPQWRPAKLPDPNDHRLFPKQPVVSADRCPTYVCPILPAAVSSRLMTPSILAELRWKPAPTPLPSITLCRLGVHATFPPLLPRSANESTAWHLTGYPMARVVDNVYDLDDVSTNQSTDESVRGE